jgi:hypothetical protein
MTDSFYYYSIYLLYGPSLQHCIASIKRQHNMEFHIEYEIMSINMKGNILCVSRSDRLNIRFTANRNSLIFP